MNPFNYSYPVNVYFGEGVAKENVPTELSKVGSTVMLAYVNHNRMYVCY